MRGWPDYLLLGEWYGRASLEQLRPGSQYMVQVSSLNQEGYSKFSPVTFFNTPVQGKITYQFLSPSSQSSVTENFQNEAISNKKVSSSSAKATISVLTTLLVTTVFTLI